MDTQPNHAHSAPGDGPLTSPSKVRSSIIDPDPTHWVPHKYTRLENCSIDFISELLTTLEPITFSKFALKAIKTSRLKRLLELLGSLAGCHGPPRSQERSATFRR